MSNESAVNLDMIYYVPTLDFLISVGTPITVGMGIFQKINT